MQIARRARRRHLGEKMLATATPTANTSTARKA
jgi:hypothetical protein